MKLIKLEKDKYKGHEVVLDYTTKHYYDTIINNFKVSFVKKDLTEPYKKVSRSHLFEDHWEDPSAFGLLVDEKLIGFLEVNREKWSNRLRVTNISVLEEYKNKGYGTVLMNKVKEIAKAEGFRAIILETQTLNTKAIDFYIKQGFELGGFDKTCYSNQDITNKEVRIEFVHFL